MLKKIFKPFYLFNLSASLLLQVVALILVYILSPEDYGYYALLTSVAQIMYILCSGWNNATVVNLGTKAFKETGTYKDIIVYRSYLIGICFAIISVLFLLFKGYITEFVGSDTNYTLVFIFFFGSVCFDFVSQILYPGDKNFIQASAVFVTNFIILLYVLFFVSNINEYIYFNSSAQFVLFIVLCSLFYHYFGMSKFIFDKNKFKRVLVYSSWQLFGVLGVYLINLGTNYVLRYYHISVADIGLYNFAYKLFCGFVPLFALCGVIIPKWVHEPSIKNKNSFIIKRLGVFYVMTLALYLAVYFILPIFLRLIGKTDYMDSVGMYLMLFLGFVFLSLNQLVNPILLNTPYYKHSQYSAILHGLALLVISFTLVGKYGMTGAIYANVISFAIGTIYNIVIYKTKVYPFLKEGGK